MVSRHLPGGKGTMGQAAKFIIELLLEKKGDGRFYVRSPNLAGLHLAGSDIEAIRADIEPVVKDLLFYNKNFRTDEIVWVPSLEQITEAMTQPRREIESVEKFLVITGRAAA